ncbi:MAG: hypothetical protein AB7T37_17065 [Dehalococcoidia bacterium]
MMNKVIYIYVAVLFLTVGTLAFIGFIPTPLMLLVLPLVIAAGIYFERWKKRANVWGRSRPVARKRTDSVPVARKRRRRVHRG